MSEPNLQFQITPYTQQVDLAKALWVALEDGLVGCYESPTGTGKSLAVLTGALGWLTKVEKDILDSVRAEEKKKSSSSTFGATNSSSASQSNDSDWLQVLLSKSMPTEKKSMSDMNMTHGITRYDRILRRIQSAKNAPRTEAELRARAVSAKLRSGDFFRGKSTAMAALQAASFADDEEAEEQSVRNALNGNGEEKDFLLAPYDPEEKNKRELYYDESSEEESEPSDSEDDQHSSLNPAQLAQKIANRRREKRRLAKSGYDEDKHWASLELPRIIFCSRTHSQLAQFLSELSKTPFRDTRSVVLGARRSLCIHPEVRSLGSDHRINEKCLDMASGSVVRTDQDSSNPKRKRNNPESLRSPTSGEPITTAKGKCGFHSRNKEKQLAYSLLSEATDMEDLVSIGKTNHACPYYATRAAVPYAQLVCVPYTTLLHSDMRAHAGLVLDKRTVVIIDEAHNLVEAINSVHSSAVSYTDLVTAENSITEYLKVFENRLLGRNLTFIRMLQMVIGKLKTCLQNTISHSSSSTQRDGENIHVETPKPPQQKKETSVLSFLAAKKKVSTGPTMAPTTITPEIVSPVSSNSTVLSSAGKRTPCTNSNQLGQTVNSFLFESGLDTLNFFSLRRYLDETNFVNRIGGYADYSAAKQRADPSSQLSHHRDINSEDIRSSRLALRGLVGFITSLTNADVDGRIFVDGNQGTSSNSGGQIKFVLLNPETYFKPILTNARSVVLLGGTMQPFSYFDNTLFRNTAPERLKYFQCGHVVSSSQICLRIVNGYSVDGHNIPFEFTFGKRSQPTIMRGIGEALIELAKTVPKGMVVFFPSYSYLSTMYAYWRTSGILRRLEEVKIVLSEPNSHSGQTLESVWNQYQEAILSTKPSKQENSHGAILLSVIGGKLSEGINFSDDLARCVAVVGLPYPDVNDPVLRAKVSHYNSLARDVRPSSGTSNTDIIPLPEALCMKAVNQAIGRAIRHRGDYSSVVLFDTRYSGNRIFQQLPSWMRNNVNTPANFTSSLDATLVDLTQFYATNKARSHTNSV